MVTDSQSTKQLKSDAPYLLSLSFVKLKKLPEGCNQMQEASIYVFFWKANLFCPKISEASLTGISF